MKIKTILIDDEKASLDALAWELEPHFSDFKIMASCHTPKDGIEAIRHHQPDLVFLDIEMPGMNGFELLLELGDEHNFSVIFTTAYDEFAVKAIRADALDYLLKPIDATELSEALEKVKKRRSNSSAESVLKSYLEQVAQSNKAVEKLVLPTQEGMEFIDPSLVTHCVSDGNYTRIFAQGENPLLISKTLKEIEDMLSPSSFFRVHHSYLVNLNFIRKYLRGTSGQLVLQDGTEVPVARRRKDELLQKLVS